uniref:Lipid-A-disaccharide synthase n=1 Tax=Dictyoglomus thermophilum TaxID=14 RepID=A0A7C3RWB4_DICTH
MRVLFISNGYGEDYVAVNIIKELREIDSSIEIEALPIVGEGFLYKKNQIPLLGPHKKLPSGGFITNLRILYKDLKEGLLNLHRKQWGEIKKWSKKNGYIIAVGDIIPLFLARLSHQKFFFVSIQKSVYYTLKDDKKVNIQKLSKNKAMEIAIRTYLLEYFLMKSENLLKVFPRDLLSHLILEKTGINSEYLGNPMMDGLEPENKIPINNFYNYIKILILPGSKIPEAYYNFQLLTEGILHLLRSRLEEKFLFLTAISPNIPIKELENILFSKNFKKYIETKDYILFKNNSHALILTHAFSDCIHHAQIGLCMAGTATEQFVGLGKPAIAIFGKGPQFTKKFALLQKRLLGDSLFLAKNAEEIPKIFSMIHNNNELLEKISINGRKRMGEKGASKRIAEKIYQIIKV